MSTIPAPSMLSGSAGNTTAACTQLQIKVQCVTTGLTPRLSKLAYLTWEGYSIKVAFFQQRAPTRKVRFYWNFTVGEVTHPHVFRSHELPLFAAFLAECHKRFASVVRNNTFDKKALEGIY